MACKSTWSGMAHSPHVAVAWRHVAKHGQRARWALQTFGVAAQSFVCARHGDLCTPGQHRFGMQGFNGNIAALHDLGIPGTSTIVKCRPWSRMAQHVYAKVSAWIRSTKANPDRCALCVRRAAGMGFEDGTVNDSYYAPSNMSEFRVTWPRSVPIQPDKSC